MLNRRQGKEEWKMNKTNIAIIGLGDISNIYLENITNMFKEIKIIGVCDFIKERAKEVQEKYKIGKIYESMEDAFKDPEVEIVLNLTRPTEHCNVSRAALNAGKNVYSEKPLAATYEEGKELVDLAKEKDLMLGCAPDTFLGAGIQTCRELIDKGFIGELVGASAAMVCRGHEGWHPAPEFYYKHGGGPMMDMGPYYITALVNLLGGVSGLTGITKSSFDKRVITSEPLKGNIIDVEVPTFTSGIMNFDNGAVGMIFTTFDVHYDKQAKLEIYGSEGTLIVPDPNTFGGEIKLLRPEEGEYRQMPLMFDYADNSRGLGLADMAKALRTGRDYRANCDLALHVLEILTSFEKSSDQGKYISLETKYDRGLAMKNNLIKGILD